VSEAAQLAGPADQGDNMGRQQDAIIIAGGDLEAGLG